jgi:hypothetical protein
MFKTFTKSFVGGGEFRELPDADYWLAREEHILSYLWQRKASVPRVNFKDNANKKLLLENVGESLDVLFNQFAHSNINSAITSQIIKKLLLAVDCIESIFDLGVLHLDIALRNIVSDDIYSDKVFLIDFSHALINGSRTQKPIPLVPTEILHHSLLFAALVADWDKFFVFSGQPTLKSPYDFMVSKELFERFWSDELQVQNLSTSHAVMCHGIGNLFIEVSECDFLSLKESIKLKELGEGLRNNSEVESLNKLIRAKQYLCEMIQIESNKNSEKTIIPNLYSSETKMAQTDDSNFENLEERVNDTQTYKYIELKSSLKEISAWIIISCQIWWIDLVVQISHTRISNSILLILFFIIFICVVAIFLSFFNAKLFARKTRMYALFFSMFGELIVLFFSQTSHMKIVWIWFPVLFAGAIASKLYLSIIKSNFS